MKQFTRIALAPLAAAAVLIASPAFAGPPLLCHPYDIGAARSLPWSGAQGWFDGDPAYRIDQVVTDTEALLTPATPVIVRMETLRRAAIYASADGPLAARLLERFVKRAEASANGGQPDALAWLDAAYLAGAYREMSMLSSDSRFAARGNGLRAALGETKDAALIARSIALRPDDASIRFAAAPSAPWCSSPGVGDQASADAGADLDEQQRRLVRGQRAGLAERAQVDVVLQEDRAAERAAQPRRRRGSRASRA